MIGLALIDFWFSLPEKLSLFSLQMKTLLGCMFFPCSTLHLSYHSILACKVFAEIAVDSSMGVPLSVILCFSLAVLRIPSSFLTFAGVQWGGHRKLARVQDSFNLLSPPCSQE